jgi:hypothetical protein
MSISPRIFQHLRSASRHVLPLNLSGESGVSPFADRFRLLETHTIDRVLTLPFFYGIAGDVFECGLGTIARLLAFFVLTGGNFKHICAEAGYLSLEAWIFLMLKHLGFRPYPKLPAWD